MTDDHAIEAACIAFNSVLLNQPEDERNQPVAMQAAIRAYLAAKEAELAAVKAMLVDDPNWICAGIPDHVVEAGIEALDKVQHDLANYVSGETADWDEGMIAAAIFKAMLRAALAAEVSFARERFDQMQELDRRDAELAAVKARVEVLREALEEAAALIGAPSSFRGLRDDDTVEICPVVTIGQIKRFRAALSEQQP